MRLTAGERLGPYQIESQIGAGGRGETYRARDTRLDRTVAVKVLPPHIAERTEARQRFEREARAVAALNHPHICTLHDIGKHDGVEFLVMEHLEGETLAARLEKGPLTLEQALAWAIEMADALAAAHRKEVCHRDLKPGNVMVTKSGVKLLDFGLAKMGAGGRPGAGNLSQLPTEDAGLTEKGSLLGTLQYMSPEQLEGKDADARSDIFSFGATLYEMLTGRKAFAARSQASVIAAIMKTEPAPMAEAGAVAPPALERVVKTCLAKDSDERWQSARDLQRELEWIAAGERAGRTPATAAAPAPQRARERTAWAAAAAAAVVAALALVWALRRESAPPAETVRFQVHSPPQATFLGLGPVWHSAAISPDGTPDEGVHVPRCGPTDPRATASRPRGGFDRRRNRATDHAGQY